MPGSAWASRSRSPALLDAAAALPRGGPTFDPDHGSFLTPGDMPARIAAWLTAAGLPVPEGRAALVRCILDSLAKASARAIDDARRLTGRSIDVIHIVGGGSRNELLCQLTADATGLPVFAGPVEATAIGNILVQARSLGLVEGGLDDLRAIVRASDPPRRFEPSTAGGVP